MPRCRIVDLPETPLVSVIVCSYNGAQNTGGMSGVVRQNQLSGLRNDPGRRWFD